MGDMSDSSFGLRAGWVHDPARLAVLRHDVGRRRSAVVNSHQLFWLSAWRDFGRPGSEGCLCWWGAAYPGWARSAPVRPVQYP